MQLFRLTFTMLLLIAARGASAAGFSVTSSADSGPGTLREAITQAIAAGDAVAKTITFNIPDTSPAGRTIDLRSELPALPSNLVIDASTESGNSFGLSDAKVELLFDINTATPSETGFYINNKSNVTITGLYLRNGFADHTNKQANIYGINVVNGANIQVGDAGKGNVIFGFAYSINVQGATNLTLKDNFCDVDIDGISIAQNLLTYYGISISDALTTINIGGATAAEGNLAEGPVHISRSAGNGLPLTTINIRYNKLNTDINTTQSLGSNSYIDIAGSSPAGDNDIVNIEDNVISGYITEEHITNTATFLRNYIDVDRTQKHILAYSYDITGITINGSTGQVVIGNPANTADGNVIAYCKPFDFEGTNQVSINRNTISCTYGLSPYYFASNYTAIPVVSFSAVSDNGLSGDATPNSSIELFYPDLCHTCSPEKYFATVKADAKGKWSYSGPIDVAVLATATLNGSTSELVNGIVFDTTNIKRVRPTCRHGYGSITGVRAPHATSYAWTDSNYNVISIEPDLLSVPAGSYTLTAYSEGCARGMLFTITQVPPTKFPDYPYVIQKSCPGIPTGYIKVTTDELVRDAGCQWIDAAGNTLRSNTGEIDFISPGTYSLYLTDQGGCQTLYKTYTVDSLATFKIRTDSMRITPDQCGHGIGSITGIYITDGQPPYTYGWINEKGKTISGKTGLANAPAGTYTFLVGDASKCGSQSIDVTIPDSALFVPAPLVSNVRVCTTGPTFIGVTGADANSVYDLYTSATATQPVAQALGGLFRVDIKQNTSYFITRVNGACESDKAEMDVTLSLSSVDIANAFTPNGDGINDYWKINHIEDYPQAMVQVFTRGGQRVFESKGYTVPFDGTYKGKKLPVGVYYYIIDLHSDCSLLSGSLTILR